MLFIGSLALMTVLPACEWLEDKAIVLAVHAWPGYEPLFLAQREGWLDATQARLLETRSATESMQALLDGAADGAALTLDEALKVRALGLPVTVVMVFDISAGADMLVAQPGIRQLADLKGRRIGFETSAVGALMLAEVLKAAELTMADIKPVSLSIDQHHQAWLGGQVDAQITYEPVASQLLAKGAVKLFDSRQIPQTIVDVLVMRSDRLDLPHGQAIRHAVVAHFKGLAHLQHNAQDAAYRMSGHLNLPAAEVLSAFKGLLLPDVVNNYSLLADQPAQLLESAAKLSTVMRQNQLLIRDDSLEGLVDAGFLPKSF